MAPGPSLRKACKPEGPFEEMPCCCCPYQFDGTVSMEPERKKARMDGAPVAVLALANNAKVVAPYPDWKFARDPQFLKVLHGELDLRKEDCKVEREEWTPSLVHQLVHSYVGLLLVRRGSDSSQGLLQQVEWEHLAAQLAGHADCKVPRSWKEVRAKFDKLRKRYLSEKLLTDGSSRWPYYAAMASVQQLTMERLGTACLDPLLPEAATPGAAVQEPLPASFHREPLSGPFGTGKEVVVSGSVSPEDASHPPQAGSSTSYNTAAAGACAGGRGPGCGNCSASWCPAVRESIRSRISRAPVYGAYCASFSPMVAEILGLARYDFVVVDLEYGPCDHAHTLPILHALASTGCPSILRLPSKASVDVRRALDLGPSGIIFSGIETAEDARRLVEECRANSARPLVRSSFYGTARPDANDLFIICEVSSVAALSNVAEIAAVEGVDCIQIVPLGLQASLGALFQDQGHAQVHEFMRKAEEAVLGCTRKTPVYLAVLATSELTSTTLFSRNYHMVSGAVDIGLLRDAAIADVANKFGRSQNTTSTNFVAHNTTSNVDSHRHNHVN